MYGFGGGNDCDGFDGICFEFVVLVGGYGFFDYECGLCVVSGGIVYLYSGGR